jgi:hypothetical protein
MEELKVQKKPLMVENFTPVKCGERIELFFFLPSGETSKNITRIFIVRGF